jgi:hypothetical protein
VEHRLWNIQPGKVLDNNYINERMKTLSKLIIR